MIGTEEKKAVKKFVEHWQGKGYEKGDTQQFWLQLLGAIGYEHKDSVLFEHHLNSGGYIDVWIRESNVMIEQKSLGIDLDKPEPRQGELKTPFKQVLDYAEDVPLSMQPAFLVTCNFDTFRVYDRNKHDKSVLEQNAFEFTLEDLKKRPDYLNFILDPANSRLEKETAVSKQAGLLIGELYDKLREGYIDPDSPKAMHDLNVLCVRLVFCLYCEDADLFVKDSFLNYLKGVAPGDVRLKLKHLFHALDTQKGERDPYDTGIKIFPYVNGGLFKEDIEIPNFTQETLNFLLNEVSAPVDWSQISPTIFGGIFESTLNPETRRSGGMHFTPVENIHKVIDPLFLDDLWKEFHSIREDEDLTPIEKDAKFREFHKYLCSLNFLDPACGSGNFLTETYLSLRKLEDAILGEYLVKTKNDRGRYEYTEGAQMEMSQFHQEDSGDRISLAQFHGIEINDFAVAVAETALWISRLKANTETLTLYSLPGKNFPLEERANIVEGNALRLTWNDILPPEKCNYIMGNPPFVGQRYISREQHKDIISVLHGWDNAGKVDYVVGWYKKANDYIEQTSIRCALVSTNSITQGEQVAYVWEPLMTSGLNIQFAYRTFVWDSDTNTKAHVHCVIIGFSRQNQDNKYIYADNRVSKVKHINGYLVDAEDIFVKRRKQPLCNVPQMCTGNRQADGGHLTLSQEERDELIAKEPKSKKYIRRMYGSVEFLNKKDLFCLWLLDASEQDLEAMPLVQERVNLCKEHRLMGKPDRRRLSATPALFREQLNPDTAIIIPTVSSERRSYVPMGFIDKTIIVNANAQVIANASIYHFGVLESKIHMAWMRVVAGRLKSDYRYSKDVVYNNFIWPNPSSEQRQAIEQCAQAVLDARNAHANDSLAQMYDGISPRPKDASKSDIKKFDQRKYDDLLNAHKELDAAVEAAYGVDFQGDEEKIVAHLFKLYEEATHKEKKETPPEQPKPAPAKIKIKVKKK